MNDHTLSAAHRVLRLRLRPDLIVSEQGTGVQRRWIIKDPLALRYYWFSEDEFAILEMLDGTVTPETVKTRFEAKYPPRRITLETLQAFLYSLHRDGLLLSEGSALAHQLLECRTRRRQRQWLDNCTGILAIRFPGFQPEALLARLYPYSRWVFTTWILITLISLAVLGGIRVLLDFDDFRARLPEIEAFLSGRNLLLLAAVIAMVKIAHELAHALTCKHFGAECHEIGCLFLAFVPCLYCDVSDAWMLPERRKRILVSAAGICLELILAGILTHLWWYSRPSVWNAICFNVMVVCGINTLLINGNPLLRYDGYFIFMDLIAMPNLWQESRAQVQQSLTSLAFGEKRARQVPSTKRAIFQLGFGLSSMAYRIVVIAAICYAFYRLLTPLDLRIVAWMISSSIVLGAVVPSTYLWFRDLAAHWVVARPNPLRVILTCLAVLIVGTIIGYLPVSRYVRAPAVVESSEDERVYVTVPGRLLDSVHVGDYVVAGDVIAHLENVELESDIARLTAETRLLQRRLENLQLQRFQQPEVAVLIPATRESLTDVQKRLAQRQEEQQSLTLRAPVSGKVLPPARRLEATDGSVILKTWSDVSLNPENKGCYLNRGDVLCLIGSNKRREISVYIPETEVQQVRPGQHVRLALEMAPSRLLHGTLRDVSRHPLESSPRELMVRSLLPSVRDGEREFRPVTTHYQGRVEVMDEDVVLFLGSTGEAKIQVESQSLGKRLSNRASAILRQTR